MTDPLGLIGAGGAGRMQPGSISNNNSPLNAGASGAPQFAQILREQLGEVNAVQQDATKAVEDLMTGKRDDLEGVILATEKADTAFRMLQTMRNKVMTAYEEVKQIRV
ncbi:MAG: flagellar hook-basal body complex protein FliE [Phycisphaerales bacterium]|jgi:flagellar hook-basal body complex protein FliE